MHTNTHTYSCGQKFPYACKEHVLYVMAIKSFVQPLYFCDGIKYIHAFWVFYKLIMGLLKTLPNLLGQKYTYSNANNWLRVPWPFSPQLILVALHKILVKSLTTPLDSVDAVQLNLLAF